MISVVIGAVLAALFAGLLIVRVRYGALRLSELPVLLWCLLAGPDYRRQLRGVLERREFQQETALAASPRVARPPIVDSHPERLPEGYARCPRSHSYYADRSRPRCFECEEERHDKLHPDTTGPASVDQYAAWLRGYVKQGGKPTHFYDYPFSRAGFRYASTRLTIDSGYEFGARSRMIVVASGVETQRTNPAGSFGGWGHTKVFFMHGYRTNDNTVPVYSDPEFDFARRCGPAHSPA